MNFGQVQGPKKAENWHQIQMAKTEHNYCIMLEFKGQIFPFVVGTDNFEEFKRNIKHTVKETTLSPDTTQHCHMILNLMEK